MGKQSAMDPVQADVWRTVEALNRAWTKGDPADLRGFFHERMIAVTPADRLPLTSGKACVSAWSRYAEGTKILSWSTSDADIRVFGDTAVVTYLFSMKCERDGFAFEPAGRDMMVLIREAGRWRVIADQFSPFPDEAS